MPDAAAADEIMKLTRASYPVPCLPALYHNKFVAVRGYEIIGAWDTLNEAYNYLNSNGDGGAYLIRKIEPEVAVMASNSWRVSWVHQT